MFVALLASDAQNAVLSGPLIFAMLVAALAGAISFFSPCCLPLVPVYLGYVSGVAGAPGRAGGPEAPAGGVGRSRLVVGTGLFVLGFSTVFTAYGAAFGQLGLALVRYQDTLIRVSGATTLIMGLVFFGAFARLPLVGSTYRPRRTPPVGLLGAPVLGGLFAIGWTPCIGPTLAAVLALSTTSATADRGAVLTFAYSVGLGVPFLVAAFSFGRATRPYGWARRHVRVIVRGGGAFLVLIGLAQLTGVWSTGLAQLQGVIGGWQSPL